MSTTLYRALLGCHAYAAAEHFRGSCRGTNPPQAPVEAPFPAPLTDRETEAQRADVHWPKSHDSVEEQTLLLSSGWLQRRVFVFLWVFFFLP